MRLLIRVLCSYKHSNNTLSHKKCVAFILNLDYIIYIRSTPVPTAFSGYRENRHCAAVICIGKSYSESFPL